MCEEEEERERSMNSADTNSGGSVDEASDVRQSALESNVFEEQGIRFSDWVIPVPLFYQDERVTLMETARKGLPPSYTTGNQTITLYARILEEETTIPEDRVRNEGKQPAMKSLMFGSKPCLLYLEGGPGVAPPRIAVPFLKELIKRYNIILMDQRGTGFSSNITVNSLEKVGKDAEEAGMDRDFAIASYLTLFRANSIVEDAERLRKSLGVSRWSILGASFGGFCCLTYMSYHPSVLNGVLISGGVPDTSADCSCDEVYRYNYRRLREQNKSFYEKYPQDNSRVQKIVTELGRNPVELNHGGKLTARRFLRLGVLLGVRGSAGQADLHRIIESAFVPVVDPTTDGRSELISYNVELKDSDRFAENYLSRDTFSWHMLYHLLHESIYCSRKGHSSNWAAHRTQRQVDFADFARAMGSSDVQHIQTNGEPRKRRRINEHSSAGPLFSGEMVYPEDHYDYSFLRSFEGAANILSTWKDWPTLYDEDVLATAHIPVAAVVYSEDIFVPKELSEKTLKKLPGAEWEVVASCDHSALGTHGGLVVSVLLSLFERACCRVVEQTSNGDGEIMRPLK